MLFLNKVLPRTEKTYKVFFSSPQNVCPRNSTKLTVIPTAVYKLSELPKKARFFIELCFLLCLFAKETTTIRTTAIGYDTDFFFYDKFTTLF